MARMSPDPLETHLVLGVYGQEALPEVGVLLLGKPLPRPIEHPALLHGVHHILAVANDGDLMTFALERLQRHDHRKQFHAVVRGAAETAPELLAVSPGLQHRAIAAGAGVAAGGTIGVYRDLHAGMATKNATCPHPAQRVESRLPFSFAETGT